MASRNLLRWEDDRAEAEHGVYMLQVERVRGEPPYYSLMYWPKGSSQGVILGDSLPENATDWSKAGTRREVMRFAEFHNRQQMEESA